MREKPRMTPILLTQTKGKRKVLFIAGEDWGRSRFGEENKHWKYI